MQESEYIPRNLIKPQLTGEYLIAPAPVDEVPEGKIVIQIDPNSRFGRGRHVSTRLILQLLSSSVPKGGKVLDAGTGTGVLAIAAIKSGASEALAFDNHDWVKEDAVKNFNVNGVKDQIMFRFGSIESVPERGFDLILANITVGVLQEMIPAFSEKLKSGGRLLLSGILQRDKDILDVLSENGFSFVEDRTEDEWWAVAAERE